MIKIVLSITTKKKYEKKKNLYFLSFRDLPFAKFK